MRNIACILFASLITSILSGQGIYNNGGKIVVGSGAFLNITGTAGNYRNETNIADGGVDLSGTLQVEGNITNNVTAADIFINSGTAGTVVLNGTALQTIGGTTGASLIFNNLTINNAGGIALAKNIRVNGTLTLTSGLLDIGSNNLTLGLLAAVAGTPSATSMIVATGSGQVQKEYSSTGSFTFPVGDNNVVAEYSPITLNFTAGTFAPGAQAGINLVNAKYNDPAISGSYLNRYWNITQTGITGFMCNALFQYLAADVVGLESSIYDIQVAPAPFALLDPANPGLHQLTATGLTSFGTFTGALGYRSLNIKLYLEALYNGGGVMRQAQGILGNQFPGTTADQISVELHSAVTGQYATIDYSAPNVDLNTSGQATINVPATFNGSYYLTIRHRNSITTTTAAPVSLAAPTLSYDFSTAAAQAFGGNMKNAGGVFLIYGGDINQDGFVGVSDMLGIDNQSALFGSGYLAEDANGDGFVGVTDMSLVDNNSTNFISAITP